MIKKKQIVWRIHGGAASIIRKLCEYKGVEILEAKACPDHIHMPVSIPPKCSVSLLAWTTAQVLKFCIYLAVNRTIDWGC